MVRDILLHLAESQRGCAWSAVAVAKEEGTGGKSFPIGEGILGGNQRRTHCTRLCWELPSRGMFRKRGTISHTITFLDDMAVHVPMLDAWDQFIWPPSAAMPWATTEVEQYGYHCRNAMDISAVMLAMELRVTDEEGAYLYVARGLIFEGSVLAYTATRDEAEWVPTRGSPMTSAGQRRGQLSCWQILCHMSPRRWTVSWSSGPAASWAGTMIPPWRKMMSRHKRRKTS